MGVIRSTTTTATARFRRDAASWCRRRPAGPRARVGGSGQTDAFWIWWCCSYLQWDFDDIWRGERKGGFRSYCHPDQFEASRLSSITTTAMPLTEVSQRSGLETGKGLGAGDCRHNRDGHIDVFAANDSIS